MQMKLMRLPWRALMARQQLRFYLSNLSGNVTKEEVLERYCSVFKPGGVKPLGSPLHIEMDPEVTPVHPRRHRVPVAKLDRINDELKRLCDEGIIRPGTQPTV